MTRRARWGVAGALAAALAILVPWALGGRAPDYSSLGTVDLSLAATAQPGTTLERVHLTSSAGRRLECHLRRPLGSGRTASVPAVLLFGGIGTGGRAAMLVDPSLPVVVLACDYPWADPSRSPWWRILWRAPAIRADVLATPRALSLASSFVLGLPGVDRERFVGIGASLGVPFVSAWAAEDQRVRAVALVYGGGDLGVLFEANLQRRVGARWLRQVAATLGAALLRALDPARTAPRIAPRPLLLIGSEEDERVPRASVETLTRAARAPVTIVRLEGRHMMPRDTTLLRAIGDSVVGWLDRVLAPLSQSGPRGHLR